MKCLLWGMLLAGSSFISLAQTNSLLWSYNTGNYVFSSPAIDANGIIYFGSANRKLYAMNTNGTVKWSFTTGGEIQSSPAIGKDGTIYFGSADKKVYALNPNGTKKWEFLTGNLIICSPALGADKTVYIGSRDGKFYALNPDGTKKWEFVTGAYYTDMPAVIGPEGTIYLSASGKLYALNPSGKLRWELPIGGMSGGSVVVGRKGKLLVTSSPTSSTPSKMMALNHRGEQLWEFTFGNATALIAASYPAVGRDGTIYIATSDSYLYAINPDGTLKWKVLATRSQSSPALGANGNIYLNSDWDFRLLCYNTNGVKQWEYPFGGTGTMGLISSYPTLVNGRIYVGSGNGRFYAISTTDDLEDSPWPTFGRDHSHSGRDIQRGLEIDMETEERNLRLTVEPNVPYRLQFSTNLADWQDYTNFTPTNAFITIAPAKGSNYMYRLVTP